MANKKSPKKIIDSAKALRKLDRIAYQILEQNYDCESLIVLGIANKGYHLAKLLTRRLKRFGDLTIQLSYIKLDKTAPNQSEIELGDDSLDFAGKNIIIIDDVGNTGRTLFYAMLPLAQYLPKKIQAAVLVDRMHKLYPIKIDFVGTQLATTLNEEVIVEFDEKNNIEGAYLY